MWIIAGPAIERAAARWGGSGGATIDVTFGCWRSARDQSVSVSRNDAEAAASGCAGAVQTPRPRRRLGVGRRFGGGAGQREYPAILSYLFSLDMPINLLLSVSTKTSIESR